VENRDFSFVLSRYTAEKAQQTLDDGLADMIAFGRPYVANPDLVNQIKQGYPLADPVPETLFGGAATGLIDYPEYQA